MSEKEQTMQEKERKGKERNVRITVDCRLPGRWWTATCQLLSDSLQQHTSSRHVSILSRSSQLVSSSSSSSSPLHLTVTSSSSASYLCLLHHHQHYHKLIVCFSILSQSPVHALPHILAHTESWQFLVVTSVEQAQCLALAYPLAITITIIIMRLPFSLTLHSAVSFCLYVCPSLCA